jgi:Tfp pilus assembly PilM family ATPase
MPGDPGIVKLTKELQRRVILGEKEDGLAPRPWAAPPGESPLGLPLEWKTGFRRIAVSEACDRQALIDGWGCYGVACGLALQGLGLAAIRMDLRPKEKVGVVDLVSSIVRRHGSRAAWGIDVGSSSLKAVRLARDEKDGRARLDIAMCIEHQKSLGQANNEVEEQVLIEESLATLFAKHDLKNSSVVVGLPCRIVFSRMFKNPASDRKKLDAMVQHEVQRHMPVSIKHLVWDDVTMDPEEAGVHGRSAKRVRAINGEAIPKREAINGSMSHTGHKNSWNVLVTAARRSHVENRLAVMEQAGVKPRLVQSECTALYNLFAYELEAASEPKSPDALHKNGSARKVPVAGGKAALAEVVMDDVFRETDPLAAPIAVVDLGHQGSRLLVCCSNELWVRNLGFGGHLLTRALMKEFNLTTAAAERYKRDPLAAPSVSQIYSATYTVLEDLFRELQAALASVALTDERPPIKKVCLLGGGMLFHGLLQFLQSGK